MGWLESKMGVCGSCGITIIRYGGMQASGKKKDSLRLAVSVSCTFCCRCEAQKVQEECCRFASTFFLIVKTHVSSLVPLEMSHYSNFPRLLLGIVFGHVQFRFYRVTHNAQTLIN